MPHQFCFGVGLTSPSPAGVLDHPVFSLLQSICSSSTLSEVAETAEFLPLKVFVGLRHSANRQKALLTRLGSIWLHSLPKTFGNWLTHCRFGCTARQTCSRFPVLRNRCETASLIQTAFRTDHRSRRTLQQSSPSFYTLPPCYCLPLATATSQCNQMTTHTCCAVGACLNSRQAFT